MSIRVDSSSWIPGAIVVGNRGLGILADNIPATGDAGPSFLYNDNVLPADTGKEICGRVTAWPSSGTLTAYEDGSFEFSGAPDGSYSFQYTLLVDGVSQGTGTVPLQVGSPAASFAQATADTTAAFGASSKPVSSFSLSTAPTAFAGGAGTTTSAGFNLQTADATFSGGALVTGAPAAAEFNIQIDGAVAGFSALSSPVSSFVQSTADAIWLGGAAGYTPIGGSLLDEDIARIAVAVIAALNATTIPVDLQKVRGQILKGDGSEANPWNPA
mgnify:FL=1